MQSCNPQRPRTNWKSNIVESPFNRIAVIVLYICHISDCTHRLLACIINLQLPDGSNLMIQPRLIVPYHSWWVWVSFAAFGLGLPAEYFPVESCYCRQLPPSWNQLLVLAWSKAISSQSSACVHVCFGHPLHERKQPTEPPLPLLVPPQQSTIS